MALPICHEIVARGNLDIRGDRSFRPGANDGARDTSNAMTQAVLVPADAVRTFLKAGGVNVDGVSVDAKASVVRVICVGKLGGYQRRPQP